MTDHRRRETPFRRINPGGAERWVARYTNAEGRRVSAGTFKLKRQAQDAIDAAYDALGTAPEQGTITVARYAATWTQVHPRSARTNETNESRLAQVIGPFLERHAKSRQPPPPAVKIEGVPLGGWAISELRRRHMLLLVNALLVDQERSAQGAKNIILALSAMFEDAVTDEHAILNPCNGVKVRASDPRVTKAARLPRVLTWDQMHRLATAAGPNQGMLRVASDCGLRLGELLGLSAEDVKLGRCDEGGCEVTGPHLHVRRTAWRRVVTLGTKSERMRDRMEGGRVVPLPPATAVLLRDLPARIAGPMFPTPAGQVWREDKFRYRVWNPAAKASAVDASPHDFRHSWITLLRASGVDPADLAAMAGHSVMVATTNYTHALKRSYDAVADAVGRP